MVHTDRSRVVFIGGGPIALWTAVQMKLQNPKESITVLDKRTHYSRTQGLRLNPNSFQDMVEDAELQEIIEKWKKKKIVPIQEIETDLKNQAKKLGVCFATCNITSEAIRDRLHEEYPEARLFIGADGARSVVRQTLFQKMRFDYPLQYLAQVRYAVTKGNQPRKKIADLSSTYKTLKISGFVIEPSIKIKSDNLAEVTLRIFIDKETFQQIEGATLGTPYHFETEGEKLPESLKKALYYWWGSRKETAGDEVVCEEENQITAIILGVYASKEFVCEHKSRVWTLVGDAAQGFPYFRAINNGFLNGTKLATVATSALKEENISARSFTPYNNYAKKRAYIECFWAITKNCFISLAKVFLRFSNTVFWQVNKWSVQKILQFEQEGVKILQQFTNQLHRQHAS